MEVPVWTKAVGKKTVKTPVIHSRQAPAVMADILKTDKRILADCGKIQASLIPYRK